MTAHDFFKSYVKNCGTKSKVLYVSSNNLLKNIFNYFFKRHGVLNVVHKDDLCIFTLNEKNVMKMSVCFTDNFNDYKLAYRGFKVTNMNGIDVVEETQFNKDVDYKIARGNKKDLLLQHLFKLIYGI